MFSRKIAVQASGILRVAYMDAVSFNVIASQAAINAMIVGRFTVVRIYRFILSAPGERLYSKSRSSFSALGRGAARIFLRGGLKLWKQKPCKGKIACD